MPSRARSSARVIQKLSARAVSVKERVNVRLRVKWHQIVNLFACADEADRQVEFARDGHHDAALGGAIELGEYDAGAARMAPEFAGLVESVLPGGRIEHQQHVVRRA